MLMGCYALGYGIFKILIMFIPVLAKVNAMLYGMIGALIVWPIMIKTKTSEYVDKKTLNNISGFCLDVLITTSIASMSLDVIAKYWLPLLIHVVVSCAFTTVFVVWFFRKVGNPEWLKRP